MCFMNQSILLARVYNYHVQVHSATYFLKKSISLLLLEIKLPHEHHTRHGFRLSMVPQCNGGGGGEGGKGVRGFIYIFFLSTVCY